MNEIGKAIYAALTGAPALTGLLAAAGAVYHLRVPDDGVLPCVVFSKQTSVPTRTFRERVDGDIWLVKGIAQGDSPAVEDIAAAIDVVLDKAQLAVTGRNLLVCWRISDVDYPEDEGDVLYRHVGARYRVETQP